MVDKFSNMQIFVESLTVIIANMYSLPILSFEATSSLSSFLRKGGRSWDQSEWVTFSLPDATLETFQAQQPDSRAPGSELESSEALGCPLTQQQRANPASPTTPPLPVTTCLGAASREETWSAQPPDPRALTPSSGVNSESQLSPLQDRDQNSSPQPQPLEDLSSI